MLRKVEERQRPLLPNIGVLALVPDLWDSPWAARHQVLSRLARYFHVVWVNPAHEWREMFARRTASVGWNPDPPPSPGFVVYTPEFWLPKLYHPEWLARLTLEWRLKRARGLLANRGCQKIILYLWRPEFERALVSVPFDLSCYHIDDEYSFSTVDLPLDEREAGLIGTVGQVFIHSVGLIQKKGSINPHTACVPNGVDYQAYAKPLAEPPDLAPIPHPRIGYTGILKRTLDWRLCLQLAQQHPEWSFVFVGLPHPGVLSAIQGKSNRQNVFFLGAKTVRALAAYPQHFDVCIMPYRIDSHSMKYGYPLKLHEYLASGRPAVGTPLVALQEFRDVISLASTPDEWSDAITKALSPAANTPEQRATRQTVAKRHDWGHLVSYIARTMAQRLGGKFADRLLLVELEDGQT